MKSRRDDSDSYAYVELKWKWWIEC